MKIVIFGGIASSLVNFRGDLIKNLKEEGHEVIVMSGEPEMAASVWFDDMGVQYKCINMSRTGLDPIKDIRTFGAVLAFLREVRPDSILCYTIKPVIYGCLAAKIARVGVVSALITGLGYSFLGDGAARRMLNWVVRLLYKLSLSGIQNTIFQNPDDMRTFIENRLIGKTTVVTVVDGSGVNTDHFSYKPMPKNHALIMVARLLKDKGVVEYVEAADIIRGRFPDVRAMLAGKIDDNPNSVSKKDLDEWVESGKIDFLGFLDDVKPALEMATVYVLPSYREGVPRTVLEAMAIGRPIVTTDAPGCRETVDPGDGFVAVGKLKIGRNGILVPIKDSKSLADAMLWFLENSEEMHSMSVNSRKYAEDRFDVKKVNKKMIALISSRPA